MKKIFFLLLLLVQVESGFCQSFPSPTVSPVWKVGIWNYWFSDCEARHWRYGNPTTICNNSYQEVLECDYNNTNCQLKGYVRVNGSQVYARKTTSCTETDRLMYDFSLAAGSGFVMAYNIGSYDTTQAQITNTTTLSYQNISRLTQMLTYTVDPPANNYTSNMVAIEGIGCTIHPFFPLTCFGDFCETEIRLMEYRENNVVLYSEEPVFPTSCLNWVGIRENTIGNNVTLSPNPAHDQLLISSDSYFDKLLLTDGLGRTLMLMELESERLGVEADVSVLEPGIYFIQLYQRNTELCLPKKIIRE